MNDLFHRLYESYVAWAASMPDAKLSTIIRLTLLFAAPTAIYSAAFAAGHREGLRRLAAALLADGLILAVRIPLPHEPTTRAWTLTTCLLLLAYLPGIHPFLVCRQVGRQRRLRTGLYLLMGALLLVGLLWS